MARWQAQLQARLVEEVEEAMYVLKVIHRAFVQLNTALHSFGPDTSLLTYACRVPVAVKQWKKRRAAEADWHRTIHKVRACRHMHQSQHDSESIQQLLTTSLETEDLLCSNPKQHGHAEFDHATVNQLEKNIGNLGACSKATSPLGLLVAECKEGRASMHDCVWAVDLDTNDY